MRLALLIVDGFASGSHEISPEMQWVSSHVNNKTESCIIRRVGYLSLICSEITNHDVMNEPIHVLLRVVCYTAGMEKCADEQFVDIYQNFKL